MKFLFLLTLTTLMTTTAFARHDGVMIDENGLTVKLNQPVVVDESRWNFDKDTYINKTNPKIRITVIADAKGNAKSAELNGLDDEDGLFIDGAFVKKSGGIIMISATACDEVENRAIFKKLKECKKFDDEIVEIFSDQYKDEDLINKITAVEGMSKIELRKILAKESDGFNDEYKKQKKNESSGSGEIATEIRKMFQDKCSSVKRYSTKKEVAADDSVDNKTNKKAVTK